MTVLPLSLEGTFWCPEDPDVRVGGTLNASFERVELSLFGALPAPHGGLSALKLAIDPTDRTVPVIHGAAGGKRVSLFECWTADLRVGSHGTSQRLRAGAAAVGTHLTELRSAKWDISFEGLDRWARLAPPHLRRSGDLRRMDVSLEPLKDVVARLEDAVVRVTFASNAKQEGCAITLCPSVSAAVELQGPMRLAELMGAYVSPLQGLLALATGRAAAIDSLTIEPDPSEPGRSCQVFFEAITPPSRKSHDLRPDEILFDLDDVRDRFTEHLQTWFANYKDLRLACDPFFSDTYAPAPYVETRFLMQCQAAEVLHRKRFASQVRDPREHQAIIDRVVQATPPAHQSWVAEALRSTNRKRLRACILELVAHAPSAAQRIVGDLPTFAGRVVQVRNFYTHWSALPSGGRPDGAETLLLHHKLRFLVQAFLMRELGLHEALIEDALLRSRQAREIASLERNQ